METILYGWLAAAVLAVIGLAAGWRRGGKCGHGHRHHHHHTHYWRGDYGDHGHWDRDQNPELYVAPPQIPDYPLQARVEEAHEMELILRGNQAAIEAWIRRAKSGRTSAWK